MLIAPPFLVTVNSSVSKDKDNAVSVVCNLMLFHAVTAAEVTLKSARVVPVVVVVVVILLVTA